MLDAKDAAHDGLFEIGEFSFLPLAEFFFGKGRLGLVQAEHVEHHATDQGENFRRIVFLDGAGVLAEIDIEHPMQLVFHRPMSPNRLGQSLRGHVPGRDVVTLLDCARLVAHLAQGSDHGDGFATSPLGGVDTRQAGRCRPGRLHHRPAMGRIQAIRPWQCCPLLGGEDRAHLIEQPGLIAFDHEQIVPAPVNNLGGDFLLAAHGVNADQETFEVEGLEQFGNGGDFITFVIDALLAESDPQLRGESAHHVGCPAIPIRRAAKGLTINGQLSRPCRGHDLAHPAAEEGLELLGVQGPEEAVEGGRRRNPILQHQKALEPGGSGPGPQGKVLAGIHVAQAGADGDHQHLPEIVQGAVAGGTGVFNLTQTVHQAEGIQAHCTHAKDESKPDFPGVYKTYA